MKKLKFLPLNVRNFKISEHCQKLKVSEDSEEY